MKIFKLPDLGEGLPDAVIRKWHVKIKDFVREGDTIVSMETAKALVEVPSPYSGVITELFGEEGELIDTGANLIAITLPHLKTNNKERKDTSIVGNIKEESIEIPIENLDCQIKIPKDQKTYTNAPIKATPMARMLAKKENIDLESIEKSKDHITEEDVIRYIEAKKLKSCNQKVPLSSARKAMARIMSQAHSEVVLASIMDEADVSSWIDQDITTRIIKSICHAALQVPIMNSYYINQDLTTVSNTNVNLGIAIDTKNGLYVPVIKDVNSLSQHELREQIEIFKIQAKTHSIPPDNMKDATILMSNVGSICGMFSSPIVLPPMITTIAVGRIINVPTITSKGISNAKRMPITIAFDHRPVAGGDAARFLKHMMENLEKQN